MRKKCDRVILGKSLQIKNGHFESYFFSSACFVLKTHIDYYNEKDEQDNLYSERKYKSIYIAKL